MSAIATGHSTATYLVWAHDIIQPNDHRRYLEAFHEALHTRLSSDLACCVWIRRVKQTVFCETGCRLSDLTVYLGSGKSASFYHDTSPTSSVEMW